MDAIFFAFRSWDAALAAPRTISTRLRDRSL